MFRERRLIGNDNAGRMRGGMARQSFERLRHRHEFLDLHIFVDEFLEARFLFERLVERHLQIVGDQFGDPVDFGIGHFEDPPTSRMAALAFMVPNVMICATWSSPYLWMT